jgi:ATP-binding cassette subfamily B protein
MLSISYIIGEMNSPINQLISFFRSLQDAKLSFSRLNDIHNFKEETNPYIKPQNNIQLNNINQQGILFCNVNFQFEGPKSQYVLKNINHFISENKITAIVGSSGSGKTTLLKLILKYYEPINGEISINEENLKKERINYALEDSIKS